MCRTLNTMHEIELKARVVHPAETERRLLQYSSFVHRLIKTDEYWSILDKTIRIRSEYNTETDDTAVFVTQKVKHLNGILEANTELEFTLDKTALPVFKEILKNTGFILTAKKTKDTRLFQLNTEGCKEVSITPEGRFSAELSYIEPIGWFLELELLYPQDYSHGISEQSLQQMQKFLKHVLMLAGISEAAIEPRPYRVLLEEASRTGNNNHTTESLEKFT